MDPEEYPLHGEVDDGDIIPQYGFDASLLVDSPIPEVVLTSNGLHCVSHRLELTMTAAFNKLPELVELKKVNLIIFFEIKLIAFQTILSALEVFSQSPTAQQELKALTRVKLLFPTSNSWPSMFATFKRILFAFEEIQQICEVNKWEKLDDCVKHQLQCVMDLFEPILKFRKAVQVDAQPTISLVHSGIHGLVDLCRVSSVAPEAQ